MTTKEATKKYIEGMLGRKFTQDEEAVFRIAYESGSQEVYDKLINEQKHQRKEMLKDYISKKDLEYL